MLDDRMNASERRAAASIASLYALRMLGLFMILPVFPFYAQGLSDYTPQLMGLAMGIYGFTQALMQIPMGMLSDRWGRKRMIAVGLILFCIGSLIAAGAESIYVVILGRAVQGAGAVAAVLLALAADLSREQNRTKMLAIIGISIGMSFAVSIVIGPLISAWVGGVPGIFMVTAALAACGLIALIFWVPNPNKSSFHRDTQAVWQDLLPIVKDMQLLRLDVGIFVLHFVLMACFLVLPLAIREAGLAEGQHWLLYLAVIFLAMLLMAPFIMTAEKKRRMKSIYLGAILMLILTTFGFSIVYQHFWLLVVLLVGFFTAFNILEASLPSLLVKTVSPNKKGTAMGVYSSSQFFGAFFGAWMGGKLFGLFGFQAVFLSAFSMLCLWFLFAFSMRNPRYLSSYVLQVGVVNEKRAQELMMQMTKVQGVAEVVVDGQEGVAYLKVDNKAIDKAALAEFSVAQA